jgi:hypothetical protein
LLSCAVNNEAGSISVGQFEEFFMSQDIKRKCRILGFLDWRFVALPDGWQLYRSRDPVGLGIQFQNDVRRRDIRLFVS